MTTRVLIVGAGSAGRRHLALARRLLPGADIRVLRHRASEPVPEGADGLLSGVDEISGFAPGIGVVASPSTRHAESFAALLDAGADVLVEKPLAAASADAREMARAAQTGPGAALVGYNLRFTQSLRLMRSVLHDGSIGSPVAVHAEAGQWLPSWRPDADYRHTVTARRDLGGGALRELSHELDYLGWLLGPASWAMASVERRGNLDLDVDDCVQALIGYGQPAVPTTVGLDLLRRDRTRRCTIVGVDGTLTWDALTGTVSRGDETSSTLLGSFADDVAGSYLSLWEHFLACVRGEQAPLATVAEALATVQLIEACEESSTQGRRINLEVRA